MLLQSTIQNKPLSKNEQKEKQACEKSIRDYRRSFHGVGSALRTVRDRQLYREDYDSFEEYCQNEWDMSRPHVYRLMDAATVMDNLSPMGDKNSSEQMSPMGDTKGDSSPIGDSTLPLPLNERQARPLTDLGEAEQKMAWLMIVGRARKEDCRITAAFICRCLDEERNRTIRAKIGKARTLSAGTLFSEAFQLTFSQFLAGLDAEIQAVDQARRAGLAKALEEILEILRRKA